MNGLHAILLTTIVASSSFAFGQEKLPDSLNCQSPDDPSLFVSVSGGPSSPTTAVVSRGGTSVTYQIRQVEADFTPVKDGCLAWLLGPSGLVKRAFSGYEDTGTDTPGINIVNLGRDATGNFLVKIRANTADNSSLFAKGFLICK